MRSWYPRLTCAAIALATATGLAACGTHTDTNGLSGAPPIVIGASLPLTGGFSTDGIAFERGYQLWANDVNSHGGLLGRQVKLIILDNKTLEPKVQADYRTLINVDHVDLTFGPFSTLLTKDAELVLGPAGYALIEGAGGAPSVFSSPGNVKYRNVFDPSLPVIDYLKALVSWLGKLPPSQRPKTAAYPSSNDPFTLPAVAEAEKDLSKLGIRTVFTDWTNETTGGFNETTPKGAPLTTEATHAAQLVAAKGAQMVVLGSTAVSTVQAVMRVFESTHFNPKIFLATSGPDQGQAFTSAVGKFNANGVEVLGGWYGAFINPLSNHMVEEYIAQFGAQPGVGATSAGINADVAEAYSVGEVAAGAIVATGGTNNAKIINYLHSGFKFQTVQGPAQFVSSGPNTGTNPDAVAFVFQWQSGGNFVQVLSTSGPAAATLIYPKRPWGQ